MNAQIANRARAKKGTLPVNVATGTGSSRPPSTTPSEGDHAPQSQRKEIVEPQLNSTPSPNVPSQEPLAIEVTSGDTRSAARTGVYIP
ncbi:UNVERIFIED_CONTAM: hypothetical protein Sradi_1323800 [Sesamum radiatum]|uniref:Uncharacterized protein n=1 Tax=Sesamum radiatum TaxID=300843 RepID=A0AAW2URE2_SESRA